MVPCASLLLSLLLACTPLPKNVGDDELDTDSAGDTDDALDPADSMWSHLHSPGSIVYQISGTPDGGVAAIERRDDTDEQWVTRYASDGSVLWQVDVGALRLRSIATLPDGRFVVTGSMDDGGLRATVWRLSSTGAVEVTRVHPLPGDQDSSASARSLAVSSTGVAYIVANADIDAQTPHTELWRVDLDLDPQWSWSGFEGYPTDLALLPSGEVRTLEQISVNDPKLLRTFDADGTPGGQLQLPDRSGFASDEPLVVHEHSLELAQLWIHAIEGVSSLDVVIPIQVSVGGHVVTHGHGLAVAGSSGSELLLHQYDEDGTLLRELAHPPQALDLVTPLDVVIAPDGSLYVSGVEQSPTNNGSSAQGFLIKLPPP